MRHAPHACLVSLALLLGCLCARAGDIIIDTANLNVRNEIVMLDCDCRLEFSEDAIDALNSGIPLYFDLEIRFERPRRMLWDPEIYATRRRFVIERHALTERFVLTDLITEQRSVHASLERAIHELGHIRNLPIIEAATLADFDTLNVQIRLRLDINALPAPMIPLAYVSPGWRMSSGWYRWQANL